MWNNVLESEEKRFTNKKTYCFIYTMLTTSTVWISTLRYPV